MVAAPKNLHYFHLTVHLEVVRPLFLLYAPCFPLQPLKTQFKQTKCICKRKTVQTIAFNQMPTHNWFHWHKITLGKCRFIFFWLYLPHRRNQICYLILFIIFFLFRFAVVIDLLSQCSQVQVVENSTLPTNFTPYEIQANEHKCTATNVHGRNMFSHLDEKTKQMSLRRRLVLKSKSKWLNVCSQLCPLTFCREFFFLSLFLLRFVWSIRDLLFN